MRDEGLFVLVHRCGEVRAGTQSITSPAKGRENTFVLACLLARSLPCSYAQPTFFTLTQFKAQPIK